WQDRDLLRTTLAQIFADEQRARHLIQAIVPLHLVPAWTSGMASHDWWTTVFQEFDHGLTEQPFRRLLNEALARYGANQALTELRDRCLTPQVNGVAQDRPDAGADTCRVIVRADDEEQRQRAAGMLVILRLNPREVWSTAHAVSYEIGSADVEAVRRALDGTDL